MGRKAFEADTENNWSLGVLGWGTGQTALGEEAALRISLSWSCFTQQEQEAEEPGAPGRQKEHSRLGEQQSERALRNKRPEGM